MEVQNRFRLDVVSVRLVKETPLASGYPVTSPEDAVELLGKYMCEMDREVVCVINLKTDGTPINCHFASMGSMNEACVHPRELLKASILSNAASMLLVHNHPSGNLFPSKQDTKLTDRMVKLCELIGIPLLDHVIVGGDNKEYFSFREKSLLKIPEIYLTADYQTIDFQSGMVAEQEKAR